MIIMLNGTFGVGKTTIAAALQQHLPRAVIFDPESVGTLVRNLMNGVRTGSEDTDDFQDILLWRSLTTATAKGLYEQYGRPLIIPMTLVHPDCLTTIHSALAQIALVRHFCLQAPLAVIRERLLERGDDVDEWAWRQSQQYMPRFRDARYAQHIDTEHRNIEAIVGDILLSIAS